MYIAPMTPPTVKLISRMYLFVPPFPASHIFSLPSVSRDPMTSVCAKTFEEINMLWLSCTLSTATTPTHFQQCHRYYLQKALCDACGIASAQEITRKLISVSTEEGGLYSNLTYSGFRALSRTSRQNVSCWSAVQFKSIYLRSHYSDTQHSSRASELGHSTD